MNNLQLEQINNQRLQELCECAFKQGYGDMMKKSPGVYLPHIPLKIHKKLNKIIESEK